MFICNIRLQLVQVIPQGQAPSLSQCPARPCRCLSCALLYYEIAPLIRGSPATALRILWAIFWHRQKVERRCRFH